MNINKYPYTDFHELNLDWFLAQFKTLTDAWDAQKVDYEQFKTDVTTEFNNLSGKFDTLEETVQSFTSFIMNYFDNLDVQQEINNKLDEMVSDGTMTDLIKPIFDAYAAQMTQRMNVLEGRMDTFASLPEGSTTGDAELTDIRVGGNGVIYHTAGDAVRGQYNELKGFINNINDEIYVDKTLTPTTGYYCKIDGERATNVAWRTLKAHIDEVFYTDHLIGSGRTQTYGLQYASIVYQDAENNVIGTVFTAQNINDIQKSSIPEGAEYININSDQAFTVTALSVYGKIAQFEEKISDAVNNYYINNVANWIDSKGVYYVNGLTITDETFSYTQIDVSAIQNRNYSIHTYAQDSYGVAFKTAEGEYIIGYRNPVTTGYDYDITGVIPENAAFILIPCMTTRKSEMIFTVDGKQEDEISQLLDSFDTHYNAKFINNEYFFVKDNSLICSKTKIANNGTMAKYCMADVGDIIEKVRCCFKYKGGTITLITTHRNAVGFIDSIVLGSVHISYTKSRVNVSVFYKDDDDIIPTLHDIAVINYAEELPTDGMSEYTIGFDFMGNGDLKVYLPDGTDQIVNSPLFDEQNGRYVIYEMYFVNFNSSDAATYDFNRATFTGFYTKPVTGIPLRDNFARSDGNIGVAPSGHPYRLGRNAASGDTIYDEVNNIPQP